MKRSPTQREGVIAVLFLVVIAFIFAAISISMQTGQVIERRVKADHASDSASFAFASKSAQGLNFIAANNLAIAAASHMTGVLHIAADWGAIVKTLYISKSLLDDMSPALSAESLDKEMSPIYDLLAPISNLYFRSATGLTRLNGVIKSTFPYLGMIDAIATGGANAPSSIIIPFRTPPIASQPSSQEPIEGNFFSKVKSKLRGVISELKPSYEGLTTIKSDEAYCIAYHAGEQALGSAQHRTEHWIDEGTFGEKFKVLATAVNELLKIIDKIGMLANFVTLKVGFAGCGFGATGDPIGGSSSYDKALIGVALSNILHGPVSGREVNIKIGTRAVPIKPEKSAAVLAKELDDFYKADCTGDNVGKWKTRSQGSSTFTTPLDVVKGMCVYSDRTTKRQYNRFVDGYQDGSPTAGDPGSQFQVLYDYKVACYGTILFKWETYSGLVATREPGHPDPKHVVYEPASDTPPRFDRSTRDKDICEPFQANEPYGHEAFKTPVIEAYRPGPQSPPIQLPSYVNLTREKSFLHPITSGLSTTKLEDSPPKWRGKDPRPNAYAQMMELLSCAGGVPQSCTGTDAKGRYLESTENKDGSGERFKFYPDASKLNWLCPASPPDDPSASNIMETMQFDNPNDGSRWPHTYEYIGTVNGGFYDRGKPQTRYVEIQKWHNDRIKSLVNRMECHEYERYAKGYPVPPKRKVDDIDEQASHNYCSGSSHMCWQRGIQKMMEKMSKKNSLSFMVPTKNVGNVSETTLEASLHYAVLGITPVRTDNKSDLVGRNDNSPMSHCPTHMDAVATLDDGTEVPVCDIQPVIGFISRSFRDKTSGERVDRKGDDDFGGGDSNLASGGALNADSFGTSGFMAISQSGVRYEQSANEAPYAPSTDPNALPAPSLSKNYQLFWPSWKPTIEPSRVMSRLMPPVIAPLLED